MDGAWTPLALLPAAWTLVLGAALLLALRRWFDAVPARIAAVFALVLCLLLGPVLFGGKVLLPLGNLVHFVPFRRLDPPRPPTHALQGDLVHQITPWQAEVRRALEAGRWPLWNELAGLGMPLLANPQSQAFQPLVVAAGQLPLASAVGVTAALRVLLALVGMFLLLRRQRLSEPAALGGGLGYGMGGGLLLWLGWPIANAVAWTPLALYGVVRCHRDGGRRDVALLAASLVALLLGGHPETVLQACGMVALLAAACAWERRRVGAPVRPFVVRCAAAVGLAGLLVAPSLLLQQQYLPQTDRAVALRWALAVPSLEEIREELGRQEVMADWRRRVEAHTLSIISARAFGDHSLFWGATNAVEDGSACVGAALVALAFSAVARRRAPLPQEGLMKGLAAVCLLLVAQPPFANRFLGQLPLFGPSSVHQNHRLVLVLGLAAAYLGACELERWRRGDACRWAALFGGAMTAALVVWAYVGHQPSWSRGLGPVQGSWMVLQLSAVILVTGLVMLLGARSENAHAARRVAPWAAAAVIGAELLALHRFALAPGPRRLFYPETPAIRFLRSNLGEARMVGLGEALPANFGQVYGLNDARIDDPSRPSGYMELVSPLRPQPATLGNSSQLGQPGARLYDLLGVRYVIARLRDETGLPLVFRDRWAAIFEHPRPLPRLFLPPAATVYRGGHWARWTARPRDFAARALVSEGPPAAQAPRWRAKRGRAATLSSERRESGRWSARLSAPEPRLLATSIYQDGGWRLLVDGRPHGVILANGPLAASWIPAGAHRLELLYRPPRFVAGCLLAALSLAAATLGLLRPPRGGEPGR